MSRLVEFWNHDSDKIPLWARNPSWYRNQARVLNDEGEIGFEILGPKAEQAVPALMKIYEQNVSIYSQAATGRALIHIGAAAQRLALPLFLQSAASSNAVVRRVAIVTMFGMSQSENQPQMVPVLVNALADTNFLSRIVAVQVLARFGTNAEAAATALVQLLNDRDLRVRREARGA